jgi:hypothetical protein
LTAGGEAVISPRHVYVRPLHPERPRATSLAGGKVRARVNDAERPHLQAPAALRRGLFCVRGVPGSPEENVPSNREPTKRPNTK